MQKISVVIITKNEEEMIRGCLESVKWADEIIIIDSFSNDETIKICKNYTKKIYQYEFRGFSEQKNIGIRRASHDWILSLDADERISSSLAKEIKTILSKDSSQSAYLIPYKNIFLGKYMRYGGWFPEYHCRFFRKGTGIFDEKKIIHEDLIVKADIGVLNSFIYHSSHRSIESNLLKTRNYAILESERLFNNSAPKVTKSRILFGFFGHFFSRYIRAKGYKDGMEGFIESLYQSFSKSFIIPGMLWEKQKGKTSKEIYKEIDRKIQEGILD